MLRLRELAFGAWDSGLRNNIVSNGVWIIGLGAAVRCILLAIVGLLAAAGARAANIEVRNLDTATALITIEGDLELADIESFRSKAAPLAKATVAFRSDGGSLLAGIRIGMLIRVKNFISVVPDGAQCASACAVAWLGGVQRFIGTRAKIGFHAAYVQRAGSTSESGPGNAVLGAYLDQIGLPEDAIIYITQAAPNSMKWLSLEEAAQHGIDVSLLPPPDAPEPSEPNAVANQETQPGLAGRAKSMVLALAARWSLPNAETMHALDEFYAEKVFYHGKIVSRQAVVLEKLNFAERWPQRSYKIRPRSMTVTCNPVSQMCRVQGIMDRELTNPQANTKTRDVTSFDYSLAHSGESLRIASETSTISKVPASTISANPLVSVQKSLERLLAQVMHLRPHPAPDGPRPNVPVPTPRAR
jgi:hypothetical protein